MKKVTHKLRLAFLALALLAVGAVNAQTAAADAATDTGIQRNNGDGESIRLIDNKGTIKYLQSNNGITTITSTAAGNRTTTTWQLGGALSADTTIDAGTNSFTIGGENFILADVALETSGIAATTATLSGTAAPAGFTVLVRDEATGNTRKILASDLLQVQSGRIEFPAPADSTAPLDISAATDLVTSVLFNISVYRNGAKLRAGIDYTVAAGIVTVTPGGTDPNDWEIFQGDIFEVQWVN